MILLKTTQQLLKDLGVDAFIDDKCVGVYTKSGKIAFCGIQIKDGTTLHGLSLNVRNDLSLFSHIRSCGIEKPNLDSLSQHGINQTLSELYQMWVKLFKRHF